LGNTASPPAPGPDSLHETAVEFPDNKLLIDLCGEYDRNLAEIERVLGVQIVRRGNLLSVLGEEAPAAEATGVLNALYARLEGGKDVDFADVDRELRMGADDEATGGLDGNQLEMFKGGAVEIRTRKKLVEPRTDAQKAYVQSLYAHELVFGIGPAGTGKTYLAVAVGVNMFIEGHVDRIILARPAVEAGEKLGYLPGSLMEKVDPYLRPLFDALYDMMDPEKVQEYLENGAIEVAPLAYMRGRTLNDSFVILDEAQNTSPEQMKMFLTRLGFGAKMVVTGDVTQIDLPAGQHSGLKIVRDILGGIEDISFITFDSRDVVRHRLVQDIVSAYKRHSEELDRLEGDGRSSPGRRRRR